MTSRRAEIMALCALILAAASFTLMLRPILPATAGPLDQTTATPTPSIPRTFTYQGILRHPEGNPYDSGTYRMRLRIFDTPVGGTANYTETLESVAVRDGFFTVVLGDNTKIETDYIDNAQLYLDVQVDDKLLVPRQRIHAVPQALLAAKALEARHAAKAHEAATLSAQATVNGLKGIVDINGNVQINKEGDAIQTERFEHPIQITGDTQSLQFGVDSARNFAYLQSVEDNKHTRDIVLNPRGGNVGIGELEEELVSVKSDSLSPADFKALDDGTGVPDKLREPLEEKGYTLSPNGEDLQIKQEGERDWHIIDKPKGQEYRIMEHRIIEGDKETKETSIHLLWKPKATLDVNGDIVVNGEIRGKLQYTDEVRVGGGLSPCHFEGEVLVCPPAPGSEGELVRERLFGEAIPPWWFKKDLKMDADKGFCFKVGEEATGGALVGSFVRIENGKWILRVLARGDGFAFARARCAGIVD